jgi:hypothetical protein
MIEINNYLNPPLSRVAPLEWFFQRQLPILSWPEGGYPVVSAGNPAGIIRYLNGRATAQRVQWLEDEPFRPLGFRAYPNRCLLPTLQADGGITMLACILRLRNTTDAEGFSLFQLADSSGGRRPFEVPERHWMHWVEPAADVRDFLPRELLAVQ